MIERTKSRNVNDLALSLGSILLAAAVASCSKPSEASPTTSTATSESKTAAASATAPAPPPTAKAKAADATLLNAFKLGRACGDAEALRLINSVKPDPETSANAEKMQTKARDLATELGVPEPSATGKHDDTIVATVKALKAKQGDKAGAAFGAGARFTDSGVATRLEMPTSGMLADLETYLTYSGVPESVWKTDLASIKAHPDVEQIERLAHAVEKYLETGS
jgi:pyruvate/2-oxoglutarate dehydrogenase complex dihydrolipoamide acyltransferase (E2) component